MDLSNLGALGDLADKMQDAYSSGLSEMNEAGESVAEDIVPDHEIKIEIKLSAKVESHEYKVDALLNFDIELNPVLQSGNSPMGDLSSVLDNLDVDLGDDKDAVMEQLGKPRAIGVMRDIKINELIVSNPEGPIEAELNEKGTLLATIDDDKLRFNFESVLSYPNDTEAFIAIPSMEKMQENITISLDKKDEKVSYSWKEEDKDNLKVEGSIQLTEK